MNKKIIKVNTKTIYERTDYMAKAGMRRPNVNEPHGTESNHKERFNTGDPVVPEIQGKAKSGNKKAKPI